MGDTGEAIERPAPRGHRRTVDLFLTALTTVLFIGYLTVLTRAPHALSPVFMMAAGLLLIVYSVVVTFLYQLRLERRQDAGEHG